MDDDDFSETQDVDDPVVPCDPDIIPIFPLRFAIKGETLLALLKTSTTPPTPQNKDTLTHHELLRIRRGYVYVFDGDILQVFRFETDARDENGSIYRADTDIFNAPAYTFTKYAWEDGPRERWKPTGEHYPYCFVPKQTPKAWVAYSEERWPYLFFYEVETSTAFRNQVMTEIDMFLVRGSKLTLFLCAGRKLLVFSVSMEIDLVLVMAVQIDLISV